MAKTHEKGGADGSLDKYTKNNFLLISGIKILNAMLSFFFIAICIEYLGVEKYGLWVTISIFMNWIYLFDLGIGNGLRNELTQSLSDENVDDAKRIVSTSYFGLAAVVFVLIVPVVVIVWNSDISLFFSVPHELVSETKAALLILLCFFAYRLVCNLISSMLLAVGRPSASESLPLVGSALTIATALIIGKYAKLDLITLALASAVVPTVFLTIYSVICFFTCFRSIRPSFFWFDWRKGPAVFKLGFKFLYLQVGGVFFFSVGILFLGSWAGQADVALFNVLYKYFSVILIFSTAFSIPLWSVSTNAESQHKSEVHKSLLRKAAGFLLWLFVAAFALTAICKLVLRIWVPEIPEPSPLTIFLVSGFVVMQAIGHPFSAIVNGSGRVNLSAISITVRAILYYPLMAYFFRHLGGNGIILAMLMMQGFATLVQFLQVRDMTKPQDERASWNV